MILPYVFCFFGICFLIAAVILTVISAGFRRSNTLQTIGYLEKTNTQHNVYIGGKTGRWYKNWTDYSYVYRVDGKKYTLSNGAPGKQDNLKNTVTVVYQIKHPKYAYIKDLTFPIQPVFAALLFFMSACLLVPGIVLLTSV